MASVELRYVEANYLSVLIWIILVRRQLVTTQESHDLRVEGG